MRLKFIILVLIQVLLLTGIIAYRHYWVTANERILLQSAPVDPRDIFRGDYVTLTYNASTIDLDRFGVGEQFKRNDTVYALLGKKNDGTYDLASVSRTRPTSGKYLRGRVTYERDKATRREITIKPDRGDRRVFQRPWFSYKTGDRVTFCLDANGRVLTVYPEKEKNPCRAGEPFTGVVEDVKTINFRQINVEYGIEHFFVEEGRGRTIETARNARHLKVEVALRDDGKGLITGVMLDGKWIR
jgi:uncharacterized membrane-anchored protein